MKLWKTIIVAAAVLMIPAASVFAQGIITTIVFTAETSEGFFKKVIPMGDTEFKGSKKYDFTAVEPDLSDAKDIGGGCLLTSYEVIYEADPTVTLNFSVVSGGIPIIIKSSLLNFLPLTNQTAFASASLWTLDRNGGGAVADVATGDPFGGKLYEARYNGSTSFAKLIAAPVTAGAPGSDSAGPTNLGVTVNSMEAEFQFILTTGDSAGGLSYFEIVPEPSTVLLLAFLGVASLLYRRRR